jgi:hypothetical protein
MLVDPSGHFGIGSVMSISVNGILRASWNLGKFATRTAVEDFFIGELSGVFDNPNNRRGFRRAGGIVGKMIIDRAIASVMDALLLQGDKYVTKQGAGSTAHSKLEKKIKSDMEGYSWFGYGVRAEVYRYYDKGKIKSSKNRIAGSIGVDIEVYKIKTGEVKLIIDLKTGPTKMSRSRRNTLSTRAGNPNIPVIEIHVPITGRRVKL